MKKSTERRKKYDGVVKQLTCGNSGHIARNCNTASNRSNNPTERKWKAAEDHVAF